MYRVYATKIVTTEVEYLVDARDEYDAQDTVENDTDKLLVPECEENYTVEIIINDVEIEK